eukprot:scaffold191750_cov31-Tisochrysis_lutea.AAC.7
MSSVGHCGGLIGITATSGISSSLAAAAHASLPAPSSISSTTSSCAMAMAAEPSSDKVYVFGTSAPPASAWVMPALRRRCNAICLAYPPIRGGRFSVRPTGPSSSTSSTTERSDCDVAGREVLHAHAPVKEPSRAPDSKAAGIREKWPKLPERPEQTRKVVDTKHRRLVSLLSRLGDPLQLKIHLRRQFIAVGHGKLDRGVKQRLWRPYLAPLIRMRRLDLLTP